MVEGCGVGDVLDGGAFEGYAVFATLADEPGKVNCCIYADGGEAGGVVYFGGELAGWEFLELYRVSLLMGVVRVNIHWGRHL